MKNRSSNLLLIFKILTTSCLVCLTVLFQRALTNPSQPQKAVYVQNLQALQVSQQDSVSKLLVSVKDFGAVGNGIEDDTSAIQKTIDAVYSAGGGVVFFPIGTYKVRIKPSQSHAITIRSKVKLQGAGNEKSVIKLADRQGNYNSILAGERPASDLSDFAMYELVIDGNGSNNPVKAQSDLSDKTMRYSLRIFVGSRINIEKCKFKNQNNANTITVNNEQKVSNVSIKNNIFELVGGGNIDYDHSTIYTHGKRIEIVNNYFSSRNGAGTNGARTAIEIHGDEHIVKDNVITGFTNGIFVTGYARSSNNQFVTDNIIKEAHTGIIIWSYFHNGNITNPAISNCTIANNKISLNVDAWRFLWGNIPSRGITLDANSDAPLENLNILNNEISWLKFSGRGRVTDNLANGIQMWRNAAPNIGSKNIRISGNQIKNSLAAGIYISMPIKEGEISQNTILNPGKSNGNFHDDYRAAMIMDGNFEKVKLKYNLMLDNQRENTLKGGIISSIKCIAICEVYGNKLQVSSGANFPVIRLKNQPYKNFEILQ